MEDRVEDYFTAVVEQELCSCRGNLEFYLDSLFADVDLTGKAMLDIGGGSGLFSFYAASAGAEEVVCLEPEEEGSAEGAVGKFGNLQSSLSLDRVRVEPATLQSFDPGGKKFDIILLHNSINHLDEAACIGLLENEESRQVYVSILSKISHLSDTGATLIACDCSRYNFFDLIGLTNPFAPSIEWQKHQAPETWVKLLSRVGFINPRVNWSSFNSLRAIGKVLLGNRLMSYFLTSHFCLKMDKA